MLRATAALGEFKVDAFEALCSGVFFGLRPGTLAARHGVQGLLGSLGPEALRGGPIAESSYARRWCPLAGPMRVSVEIDMAPSDVTGVLFYPWLPLHDSYNLHGVRAMQ